MSDEQWKPIPGFEGRYDASDRGNIRSWIRAGDGPPRLLRQVLTHDNYYRVSLFRIDGTRLHRKVHVWVALAFRGPRPAPNYEVRHLDGNSTNNNLSNLAYGTPSENQYDAVKHGTHPQASKTHCANGHEYTPENTVARVLPSGHRQRMCRACMSKRAATIVGCPECGKSIGHMKLTRHLRTQHGVIVDRRKASA